MDNKRVHLKEDIRDPCGVNVKKGGSAFIPTLNGGDFPLRPLHPHKLKQIYELKEDLLTIRRAAVPAREVLGSLASRELSLVRKETIPYFRDVYERCIQAAEVAEYTRDTLSGVMDLHTSNQNNRLAEITTILTIVASIFIPLSFITGFYGMNLRDIPLEDSPWGYPIVLLLITGVAVAMLLYFKKKEWI